jgi:hypothetical protein
MRTLACVVLLALALAAATAANARAPAGAAAAAAESITAAATNTPQTICKQRRRSLGLQLVTNSTCNSLDATALLSRLGKMLADMQGFARRSASVSLGGCSALAQQSSAGSLYAFALQADVCLGSEADSLMRSSSSLSCSSLQWSSRAGKQQVCGNLAVGANITAARRLPAAPAPVQGTQCYCNINLAVNSAIFLVHDLSMLSNSADAA